MINQCLRESVIKKKENQNQKRQPDSNPGTVVGISLALPQQNQAAQKEVWIHLTANLTGLLQDKHNKLSERIEMLCLGFILLAQSLIFLMLFLL